MIFKNLEYLYEKYDSFFIDVYGVLYDGFGFYDHSLDLLYKLKKENKKLIILSNTTLTSEICKKKYLEKGLIESLHYDEFLSSGEIFRCNISKYIPNAKSYFTIFNQNDNLFNKSNLIKSNNIESADFIYVGAVNNKEKVFTVDDLKTKNSEYINIEDIMNIDWHKLECFENITNTLDICKKLEKTLVIVNPDIFAIESIDGYKRPILCQGAIGQFYEKIGGKSIYFGKPYSSAYDFAKSFIIDKNDKIAMIGDTLWTDILGGNIANIDTILTLTGVSGKFLELMDDKLSIQDKIKGLIEKVSPKMTHKGLIEFSQIPTYIIESFA